MSGIQRINSIARLCITWLILVVVGVRGAVAKSFEINVLPVLENDLTCWTCPNKTDNEECNNWAPDANCLGNFTWCMTIHKVDIKHHRSLIVHKKCALPSSCTKDVVGCRNTDHPDIQECISCCNIAYCNEAVPFNHTSALQLSTFLPTNTANTPSGGRAWCNIVLILSLIISLLTVNYIEDMQIIEDVSGLVSGLYHAVVRWLLCGLIVIISLYLIARRFTCDTCCTFTSLFTRLWKHGLILLDSGNRSQNEAPFHNTQSEVTNLLYNVPHTANVPHRLCARYQHLMT